MAVREDSPAVTDGDLTMFKTENVVATQSGLLLGAFERGVQVFRGVPYSVPPVGGRRFRSPTSAQIKRYSFMLEPAELVTLPSSLRVPIAPKSSRQSRRTRRA